MLLGRNDARIGRMFLRLLQLMLVLACVLPVATAQARTRAKEKEPVKQVTPVNYDDPNLAYSPDYASDSAVTCPKTLKGARLRECLLKNGLAASEEISGDPDVSTTGTSSSIH
jgi:hypothetical protein